MLIPLMVLLFLAVGLSALVAFFGERRREPLPAGAPRSYGLFGGAICPKCGRPFSRHWWAPNMLSRKFDRCPHCGRWSMVRAASPQALQAAHKPEPVAQDEAQRLEQALDESRYLDE